MHHHMNVCNAVCPELRNTVWQAAEWPAAPLPIAAGTTARSSRDGEQSAVVDLGRLGGGVAIEQIVQQLQRHGVCICSGLMATAGEAPSVCMNGHLAR
jgi:hypothetical protein